MEEAKSTLVCRAEGGPVDSGLLEQMEGALDVGLEKGFGGGDGAVDVGFGGEVDDSAGPMLGEEGGDERGVADVALHEFIGWIAAKGSEVGGIGGVGEQVKIDDGGGDCLIPVQDEIRADKPSTARYQDSIAHVASP